MLIRWQTRFSVALKLARNDNNNNNEGREIQYWLFMGCNPLDVFIFINVLEKEWRCFFLHFSWWEPTRASLPSNSRQSKTALDWKVVKSDRSACKRIWSTEKFIDAMDSFSRCAQMARWRKVSSQLCCRRSGRRARCRTLPIISSTCSEYTDAVGIRNNVREIHYFSDVDQHGYIDFTGYIFLTYHLNDGRSECLDFRQFHRLCLSQINLIWPLCSTCSMFVGKGSSLDPGLATAYPWSSSARV